MSVQHPDDLHAAASELRETPGVLVVDVFGDSARGVYAEAVVAPEYDGIPAHVTHILADCSVTITDVSSQGEPAHHILTIK